MINENRKGMVQYVGIVLLGSCSLLLPFFGMVPVEDPSPKLGVMLVFVCSFNAIFRLDWNFVRFWTHVLLLLYSQSLLYNDTPTT